MSSSLASHLTAALAGRYTIVRELGAGGMATVYLAEDVRHRRRVALKVLHSGKELFYVNAANQMVSVGVTTQPTFAIHDQRVLFAVPPDIRLNPTKQFYDVSVDDQRFLMIRSPNNPSRSGHTALVLVENWLEEVRARVRASSGASK